MVQPESAVKRRLVTPFLWGFRIFANGLKNRLIRIYIDDNSPAGYDSGDTHIAEYTYDALGRRIEMVAYNNNGTPTSTTTRYYGACPERSRGNDQRVLLETDMDGSETDVRYFVYGNYIDEVLVMADVDSGNSVTDGDYYYAHDHLYSAAALFDASGSVVERYEYDAYGEVKILTSGYGLLASSQFGNPITFTGRRADSLDPDGSGGYDLNLMYYRARTYDPQTGRFMQRDLLGIDPAGGLRNSFKVARQYKDGVNIYEYVKSNSIMNKDALGLTATPWPPKPPATSPVSDKACCKIETTHRRYTPSGFSYTTYTTCDQVTIDPKGASPSYACKCHYKNQLNVKVYGSYSGECCWCTVKLRSSPLPIVGHYFLQFDCPGGKSYAIHTFPGAGDEGIEIEDPDDAGYFGEISNWTVFSTKISCDKAAEWREQLENSSWDFSSWNLWGDGNCFQFGTAILIYMTNQCP